MSTSIKTSVIVINYNGELYLKNCLKALFSSNLHQINLEVIFVDDGSTDNSIQIAQKFPVKIIANKQNLGPVKSRNIGAKEATGKYILFLDGDVAISKNYIQELVNFLEKNSNAGIVTGKVISEKGGRMWFNFGYTPSLIKDMIGNRFFDNLILKLWHHPLVNVLKFLSRPFTLNYIKDEVTLVGWVVESAFLIRKELFDKLRGFDENFFMFYEGPDLCLRAGKLGFKTYYYPHVSAKHLGGHSHLEKRGQIFQNSYKYYFQKHPRFF